MKRTILLIAIILSGSAIVCSQEKMEVEGAIIINNSEDPTPTPGTIRFNPANNDFEGWDGYNWRSLTRMVEHTSGLLTDIDGNSYTTIILGTQVWMGENLRTSLYNDNTSIPQITDGPTWAGLTSGAWCWYNNDSSLNIPYGKLYNWNAVNTGKLCPTGWHVPTDVDWTTLKDYLDPFAGGKMKEEGTLHWNSPNDFVTNASGFTALPGGCRESNGIFVQFSDIGYYWSSTEFNSGNAWFLRLSKTSVLFFFSGSNKKEGKSVRCVKD